MLSAWSLALIQDHKLNAAILLPALVRIVASDRLGEMQHAMSAFQAVQRITCLVSTGEAGRLD